MPLTTLPVLPSNDTSARWLGSTRSEPPEYQIEDYSSSPLYSFMPRTSEVTLEQGDFTETPASYRASTSLPAPSQALQPWIFKSKHTMIHLDNRRWTTECPTFGLGSSIKGHVSLSGKSDGVEKVTISLNGYLVTSVPQKSGNSRSCFLTVSAVLFDATTEGAAKYEGIHPFELRIPPTVNISTIWSDTPPSFYCNSCSQSCEISYQLQATIDRKVAPKYEHNSVQILYLPKSSPNSPSLSVIPRPSALHGRHAAPAYFHKLARIETKPMLTFWPASVKCPPNPDLISKSYKKSIHFSIPSPRTYTSGDSIPYSISLVFPTSPCLNSLLAHAVRASLVKQLFVHGSKGPKLYREFPLTTGKITSMNEYAEGVTLLRGSIQAGEAGAERSWKVGDSAEVTYILRAHVYPPRHMQNHVPSFKYEIPVEIVTDHWGTLERELHAMAGEPTPALGLVAKKTVR